MTIGPAPMIRIERRSVRFGMASNETRDGGYRLRRLSFHPAACGFRLVHQRREPIKKVVDVVRPGARLRMPLKAERGTIGERETLQAAVEQRDVRNACVRGQGGGVDGETMILARDHHAASFEVLHRMVRTMVSKLHF